MLPKPASRSDRLLVTDSAVEFEAGVTVGGQPVLGYRLESSAGVRIQLLSYGAHLASVELADPTTSAWARITDGPTTVAGLEQSGWSYHGATIGRYANRIAGAQFVLDGQRYDLPANQGSHHLHGGPDGFSSRVWAAQLLDDDGPGVGVRFELSSRAGDSGYPGSVLVRVIYRLVDQRLDVVYEAVADAATPISLTNHAYWNLGGADIGATVADHLLTVRSDRVLIPDSDGIPQTGPPLPVAGTRFALHDAPLGPVLEAGGLDHCFVNPTVGFAESSNVESSSTATATHADTVIPVIELRHPNSGRSLGIETSQPGVQIYTGNHLDPSYRSIAFEPQAWPNSPNRDDFPSAILRVGETYRHRTIYRFGR